MRRGNSIMIRQTPARFGVDGTGSPVYGRGSNGVRHLLGGQVPPRRDKPGLRLPDHHGGHVAGHGKVGRHPRVLIQAPKGGRMHQQLRSLGQPVLLIPVGPRCDCVLPLGQDLHQEYVRGREGDWGSLGLVEGHQGRMHGDVRLRSRQLSRWRTSKVAATLRDVLH